MEQSATPSDNWLGTGQRPFIIAGPCSAETREQLLASCMPLKDAGVQALRAGIWKPRTRPGNFEGVGKPGLYWLKEAGQLLGLPVMTEVASAEHVEEALKAGIDMIWIGARTTANPFSVQEMAEAVRGVDIPVFIKNPLNPNLEYWMGAIERFERIGITRLAAIHRGFSSSRQLLYRNEPYWEIPTELRRRMPELPVLNDPSHIAGDRRLVPEVAQKALNLDFDGLMIETHINPSQALSDAQQQLTPDELKQLLDKLTYRKADATPASNLKKLEVLRSEIDDLDREMMMLLSKRQEITREIASIKLHNGMTILQRRRWAQMVEDRLNLAFKLGLDEEQLFKIFQIIHQLSIDLQHRVYEENQGETGI